MPSEQTAVGATVTEKSGCVVKIVGVLLTIPCSCLAYLFSLSSSKSQPTLGRELTRLFVRRGTQALSIAQLQWLLPSCTKVYKDWIASKAVAEGVPAELFTEAIGDEGAKLHWVGRREATKVIIHFHGGGYVMFLSPAHINFVNYIRKEVKRRSCVEVKTAILEYTLLPAYRYPAQFRQAALALQHVIESGISPSDIIISGDSAGGQLCLQILSHILHPHPALPRIQISSPLGGILALSPWVIFNSNAKSFVGNESDFVSPPRLLEWGRKFSDGTGIADGKAEPDGFWGEPLKAPPEWWHGTANATRSLMIVYGAYEAFLDDNVELVKKMLEGVAGTRADIMSIEEPKGIHVGPIMDALVGRAPSEVTQSIAEWFDELFSR